MIITDLDGTLLGSDRTVSSNNMKALKLLGKNGIKRVLATGRSCFSLKKVLEPSFPIDYLIFSSGSGIMNFKNKEVILSNGLEREEAKEIYKVLMEFKVDFMLHNPIPRNHFFKYIKRCEHNKDFLRRIEIYSEYSLPLKFDELDVDTFCQFVVVLPEHEGVSFFTEIRKVLNDYEIIRATSPLDGRSIWVEIFPKNVSKGNASKWLSGKLGVDKSKVMAVGNDYNDLDLLEWAGKSFVVENSPCELKEKHDVVDSNDNDGFSKAVYSWLKWRKTNK